ncbi:disulfide bond formation protein B [Pantoea sp. Ap-967]|uniref:disulfide bond formation protein B n=1 Tax=Pantoea sp. Ap-967 TaxID=2608362 RepID=UPI0014227753|nr:disulfide bond formation protein B [Pantoea sp. Ap-967]NIE73633.1 disulfide bond formation protein B [Pantoea sp. Ap-967]
MNAQLTDNRLGQIELAAIAGICFLLLDAFFYQLVLGELPCAFCNLIRVCLMLLGSGLLLNRVFGINPWNYVLSAFGALIGSLLSLLFMFAKAPAWTKPTGSAIFGLHMYTWTFMVFTAAIMFCLIMAVLYARRDTQVSEPSSLAARPKAHGLIIGVFVALVAANLVSAFLQNGFDHFMAGGQQHYRMLYDGDVMKP